MDETIDIRSRLLIAFLEHLETNVVDLDFGLRHWRHREPREEELPCVSLRYVARDLPGVQGAPDMDVAQHSTSEEIIELSVDLIADADLPDEESQGDPTGLRVPARMLERCLDTVYTIGEQPADLGGLVWNIRFDGDAAGDETEISHPDRARLAERVTLVYRARSEYPIGIIDGS